MPTKEYFANPCLEYCMCIHSEIKCEQKQCEIQPKPEIGIDCKLEKPENECCEKWICGKIKRKTYN